MRHSNGPRKNRKERGMSQRHPADSKETKIGGVQTGADRSCNIRASIHTVNLQQSPALKTNLELIINHPLVAPYETGHEQENLEIWDPASTAAPLRSTATDVTSAWGQFFPRTSASSQDASFDTEKFDDDQNVQAPPYPLANHSFGRGPGGRHAWKTLLFWKQPTRSPGMQSITGKAAFTPLHHHKLAALAPGHKSAGDTSEQISPPTAAAPLYIDESSASPVQQSSQRRTWCEPFRGCKLSTPRRQPPDGFCNMSQYVLLDDHRSQRLVSGPLYLV
ncbi:uncharacterized protein [Physcomitrium patens]|uniref:Uncharacterized protein n=1 Tax=Physcomitrium patens TaxID=3218 RepID=A0A7I4C8I9_PHYPA|nr:uncharacterized protein LOC112273996 isoform X2 [Physcomitrium patens]|eukprot:XP_024358888.1 uncharacterized protein LOC112273996 isoform X2 [Physcomitrella patens]